MEVEKLVSGTVWIDRVDEEEYPVNFCYDDVNMQKYIVLVISNKRE